MRKPLAETSERHQKRVLLDKLGYEIVIESSQNKLASNERLIEAHQEKMRVHASLASKLQKENLGLKLKIKQARQSLEDMNGYSIGKEKCSRS